MHIKPSASASLVGLLAKSSVLSSRLVAAVDHESCVVAAVDHESCVVAAVDHESCVVAAVDHESLCCGGSGSCGDAETVTM